MITLSPFLRASRGRISQGEKQAEALNRVVSVLLQGIALHGFDYDPEAFAVFQGSIRKLRAELETMEDEDSALLLAGAAIRMLEQHNEAATNHLKARQNEVESAIAILSEALLEVSKAGPDTMVEMKEIERDLASATRRDTLVAAKSRLGDCVSRIRKEALTAKKKGKIPTWPDAETDSVTGLPDSVYATESISSIWNRRADYFAAVIAMERLETINLRFGFKTGDQLLAVLSQRIARSVHPDDLLFRWRGPCLVLLMERRVPEPLVAAELARMLNTRIEHAITIRDREVMVPIAATWNLLALRHASTVDEVVDRMNQFAAVRSPAARQMTVGAT